MDYQGPERRAENKRLDEAIAEVQRLHGTAEILANAVANTAPKHELEAIRAEVKRDFEIKIVFQAALTLVACLFLLWYMQVKFANNQKSINKGHDVLICMLQKTEAQRTGDFSDSARVACEQRSD